MKSKIVLGSELKPGDILVAASVLFLLVQITKDSYLKALEINQKASFLYYKYYPKSQYRILVCS
jgi:hypothetical protein